VVRFKRTDVDEWLDKLRETPNNTKT
jgi:hypothetical protein